MKPGISRKTSSPKQIGGNNAPDTVSYARCSKLPPMHVDEATSRIFSNMFTAYRLNHCAYKSKQFILKSLSAENSRHEYIIGEEKNECCLSSTIPANLYDKLYDDTASLAFSDVSSITLPEVQCRNSESLLEWIFALLSCANRTEVECDDTLFSFD
mmetsp:Transcript_5711/g.6638  ORF Transcript_5711/g.6638 Transcript_5711/m.6638 type:complete len:156 (+) Transcript_5711:107-574(+)